MIQCKKTTPLAPNSLMLNSAFIKTGLVSNVFGAYFGILADYKWLNGTPSTFNKTRIEKGFLRIVVGFILLIIFILPYYLLKATWNIYILYIFKSTLPFLLCMFLLFSYVKIVFLKLNIANR